MHKNFWIAIGCCWLAATPWSGRAQYAGQHPSAMAAKIKVPVKAYSFELKDVRLLPGPFKDNMERDAAWIMSIGTDRLLHDFRVNAGMHLDAAALGGWESMDSELRGHTTGHVMSALALLYASTGDTAYKAKGDSLVAGLAEVQRVLHQNGYLSAFPQHLIDRCIAGKPVWAPWYTLHKIMAGLLDMYWYAGNHQALETAEKMASWAYGKLSPLSPAQLEVMLRNEYGGVNESFYNLYAITGNREDLALAGMFYNRKLMDPLAEGKDELGGLHANTQIPKVIGEARGYELTGDPRLARIARYFWNTVVGTQTYATGGNSDHEHFVNPGDLSGHITGYTQETCNTYNMLKLTRHLFTWSAGERYLDYYERALYNDILPQQDPASGMVCYFTPLKAGVFKVYSTRYESFWCCVGTGFENHAKYGEGIYYHDDKGLYVALFIPSVLHWKGKGITVIQQTGYPLSPTTTLTIHTEGTVAMPVYIRYPAWAVSGATVTVNDTPVRITQHSGSFITLSGPWKDGDVIRVTYPMSLRLIATPDDPSVAAVAYGPLVLAAAEGTKDIVPPAPFSDPDKHNDYYTYDYHIPPGIPDHLRREGSNISDWIHRVPGEALRFRAEDGKGQSVTLEPFYQIHRQRYVVYWHLEGKR